MGVLRVVGGSSQVVQVALGPRDADSRVNGTSMVASSVRAVSPRGGIGLTWCRELQLRLTRRWLRRGVCGAVMVLVAVIVVGVASGSKGFVDASHYGEIVGTVSRCQIGETACVPFSAKVTLYGWGPTRGHLVARGVASDGDFRFRVAPGSYFVVANEARYGGARLHCLGSPVKVRRDQHVRDYVLCYSPVR